MTCSQDQTYRDVLCGARDAVLELGESKMHSFVCGDEESDQSALRNTYTNELKVQFLTYSIRVADRLDLVDVDCETC